MGRPRSRASSCAPCFTLSLVATTDFLKSRSRTPAPCRNRNMPPSRYKRRSDPRNTKRSNPGKTPCYESFQAASFLRWALGWRLSPTRSGTPFLFAARGSAALWLRPSGRARGLQSARFSKDPPAPAPTTCGSLVARFGRRSSGWPVTPPVDTPPSPGDTSPRGPVQRTLRAPARRVHAPSVSTKEFPMRRFVAFAMLVPLRRSRRPRHLDDPPGSRPDEPPAAP